MSALAQHTPEQWLAEGFAQWVRHWSASSGADPRSTMRASQAAHALSLAHSEGHVCLLLENLTEATEGDTLDRWRKSLLSSGVVGTATEPGSLPLVLDSDDRLYLHKAFAQERQLAQRLVRCAHNLPPAPTPEMARQLQQLFAANTAALNGDTDWQMLATALALRSRLTVISGGPGTGKTTTVVNLLACLLAQSPQARIVLAAPTGKAAARMSEALRQRAAHLPDAVRVALPTESYTIHRLLGALPDGGFTHDASNPLALDALVVDEASMLDLALATRLMDAVPESARIVLLGDKDQLCAVESGAVFAELSADPGLSLHCKAQLGVMCGIEADSITTSPAAMVSALPDTVVWFNRNFRFAINSGIGRLAAGIVGGRATAVLNWLRQDTDPTVQWIDDDARQPQSPAWHAIEAGFDPYRAACRQDLTANEALPALHDAFARFRVLCAMREGPRGVLSVNEQVSRWLRQGLSAKSDPDPLSNWFAGRPVMVQRNDQSLKLYNGDIGITMPSPEGRWEVWFPATDGGFRAVPAVRLPPHQTAFAMTVHKSQGSEFDAALVLMPAQMGKVLSRELLYTAITRARHKVHLVAGAAVLRGAIQSSTRRHSGLLARMAEAISAGDSAA